MTANQIAYWANQEAKRAHLASEGETHRANVAKERENYRSNTAKEYENYRHNVVSETLEAAGQKITKDHYDAQERQALRDLMEDHRHNVATESETQRTNIAKELETQRSNQAKEAETHRSNVAAETETKRYNKNKNATDYMNAANNIFTGQTDSVEGAVRGFRDFATGFASLAGLGANK